jgi:succinate dehydrogenase / fumarate reductase, cytochrome b subunit
MFTWMGVLPLGGFLIVHLAINAFALRGAGRFATVLGAVHRVPGLGVLEACFILLPLAVHGAMGVWLVATQRPLATPRPYSPNMRVAMRIAGIGVLAFLAMHLPEFRWRDAGERLGGSATADLLAADLSWTWQGLPWRALAYLVGAGCAAFHFGVGFWGLFAGSSQGQSSSRARVTAAWGLGAASFAIWLGFANVVVLHATGAALFGLAPAAADTAGTGPCPPPNLPH